MADRSKEESQTNAAARRAGGEFVRGISGFRHVIGESTDFPAEPGRYHLFVALNCPWCHRVTLARTLLGLAESVTMDVAFPNRTDETHPKGANLWYFAPERPASATGVPFDACTWETGTGQSFEVVKQIYEAEGSEEKSVPVLYDKQTKRIVNNESAEIIRMVSAAAAPLGACPVPGVPPTLYPFASSDTALRAEIDALNETIYVAINNGAYKAGFSSDQGVYAAAFEVYFETLSTLEHRLSDGRPYLMGDQLTEADVRLFPTLYRHDPIYYLRMKLNGAKILDYPNLWRWLCRVHALPGVAEISALDYCKQGYFGRSWNGVVPRGPLHPMPYPKAYAHAELARDAAKPKTS